MSTLFDMADLFCELEKAMIESMVKRTSEKTETDISKSEMYMKEIREAANTLLNDIWPLIETKLSEDYQTGYEKGYDAGRY